MGPPMLPVQMVCDMVCDPRGPPLPPGDPRGDPRGPPRTPEGIPATHLEPPWMPEGTPADPRGPPMLPVEMVRKMVCDPRGPPRPPGDPRGDPEGSRQDGLRAASEEGMQENAGLHHGQRAGVQRDVREWGRLRSHPKEEVVQEGGLCPGSRGRLRLRGLLGLRGGRRSRRPNPAWSRAGARLAPRAPAGRCAPRAALADLA